MIEETNAAEHYERTKFDYIQREHLPYFNLNLRSYGQLFVLVLGLLEYIL